MEPEAADLRSGVDYRREHERMQRERHLGGLAEPLDEMVEADVLIGPPRSVTKT